MATVYEEEIRELVKGIHQAPGRLMLVTAGAGTQALAWLLGVSGATRTLLEALIPYDESSFDDFLGRKPRKYVTSRTAGLLAGRGLVRANYLYAGEEPLIGLACSATIVTDRPKKGQHRAHIVLWTKDVVDRYAIYLHKGIRDRRGEEELVSLVIMKALANAYGLDWAMELPLREGDRWCSASTDISRGIGLLLSGSIDRFGIKDDGRPYKRRDRPKAILSGAFNPLHEGHLGLATAASRLLGHEVVFELAAVNAGKPTLTPEQCARRLQQFAGNNTVLLSGAPLFSDKARLYPGATFVVGVDTGQRILQPRFYGDQTEGMFEALGFIKQQRCRFLVAGRIDEDGQYHSASDLEVPEAFATMFEAIPGDIFRIDVSSTSIRAQANSNSTR